MDISTVEQFNTKQIIEVFTNLITNKKNGKFDDNIFIVDDKMKWRGTIDYTFIKFCMKHDNQQIRLQSLALLAESKKSTHAFVEKELELVLTFLHFNIGEKLEFVPFIKKILKRINDSYATLKRQHKFLEKTLNFEQKNQTSPESFEEILQDFQQKILFISKTLEVYKKFCEELKHFFKNFIRLGAVNPQNRSCLLILQLVQDILSSELFGKINLDFQIIIYECMILDTYDINKEICYKILKKSNATEFLQGKESDFIKLALDLANNIRPIDSITASYLLKLSLISPDFSKAVDTFFDYEKYSNIVENSSLKLLLILIQRLQKHLQVAEKNIVLAASKHSLFGLLFCIRSLLNTVNLRKVSSEKIWKDTIGEILEMGFRLSNAVSQIVNNSSPEGHLPMDLSPKHLKVALLEERNIFVTPQIVLLCSWRTVKEVSLLFGELAANSPIFYKTSNVGLITELEFEKIGEHFVTLLCETKHRGAFEQAHVGFKMLCKRLWCLQGSAMQKLPKIWLKRLILEVAKLTNENNKLCATRRSAGVPFMIQALITSELEPKKDPKNLVFHSVMRILIGLSQLEESETLFDEIKSLIFTEELFLQNEKDALVWHDAKAEKVTEIKSHALNILRALFKNCQLGDLVQKYIADGLIAAIKSFDGKCWAERNAATLLFGSLIIRIFGVQRTKDHVNLTIHNRMTGKTFFERYPKLLNFMLEELIVFSNNHCNSIKPGVQSILLILSRLYPTYNSEAVDSDWKINDFIDLTSNCGESRVYKTRELAARALVPLLSEKNVNNILSKLLCTIINKQFSYNAAHGYMLQVLEIVKNFRFALMELPQKEFQQFFDHMNDVILENLESSNNEASCFTLAAACVNTFQEILKNSNIKWFLKETSIHKMLKKIKNHLTNLISLKNRPGKQMYEVAAIKFLIFTVQNSHYEGQFKTIEENTTDFWLELFTHGSVELQKEGWSILSTILQKKENISSFYDENFIENIAMRKSSEDPNLQNAIYEFLYTVLYKIENNSKNNEICLKIVNWLICQIKDKRSCKSGSFFKILGKAYGFLFQNEKDKEMKFNTHFKEDIYSIFVCNSWMGNSSLECRLEISKILYELRIKSTSLETSGLEFHWWTTLLNLLLDDDAKVRHNACSIICKIEPKSQLQCNDAMLQEFFEKFSNIICKNQPKVALIFLFFWAVGLVHDMDYENDETDVFTTSHNYEYFDPIKISDYCLKSMRKCEIGEDLKGSSYRKIWENYGSHLQLPFGSFDELFYQFEHCSDTMNEMENILDQNYNKKLLRWKIYEKFRLQ